MDGIITDTVRDLRNIMGEAEFLGFAKLTGDDHPIHYDEAYAKTTRFGGRLAHGLLLMAHTDTVKVDPAKWTFPPFSATRDGGYVYGRGVLDNKWQVATGIETLLLLKRNKVALDRDVIFATEAGEEAATGPGIQYLVDERWNDIDAEFCLAEGRSVVRQGGAVRYALIATTEKQPKGARLVARGPSGHGSRPLRSSAIVHLAAAVEKIAAWDPPMRFNDTTRTYFQKLAAVSPPDAAARYKALFDTGKAAAARAYLAEHEPQHYSMLHTSISPNIISGGFQSNVIPSEAEATLDIRALPDENIDAFYDQMRRVINDPAVTLVPNQANQRPGAAPSRIDSEIFRAIEAADTKIYGVPTIPSMLTGATDMAFLRACCCEPLRKYRAAALFFEDARKFEPDDMGMIFTVGAHPLALMQEDLSEAWASVASTNPRQSSAFH